MNRRLMILMIAFGLLVSSQAEAQIFRRWGSGSNRSNQQDREAAAREKDRKNDRKRVEKEAERAQKDAAKNARKRSGRGNSRRRSNDADDDRRSPSPAQTNANVTQGKFRVMVDPRTGQRWLVPANAIQGMIPIDERQVDIARQPASNSAVRQPTLVAPRAVPSQKRAVPSQPAQPQQTFTRQQSPASVGSPSAPATQTSPKPELRLSGPVPAETTTPVIPPAANSVKNTPRKTYSILERVDQPSPKGGKKSSLTPAKRKQD